MSYFLNCLLESFSSGSKFSCQTELERQAELLRNSYDYSQVGFYLVVRAREREAEQLYVSYSAR